MKDFDNLYYSIADARQELFSMLTEFQEDIPNEYSQSVNLIKAELLHHCERIAMFAKAFDPHK